MWRNRGQKNNIRGNCWDEEKMKEWLTKLERKKECMRVGGGERKSEQRGQTHGKAKESMRNGNIRLHLNN